MLNDHCTASAATPDFRDKQRAMGQANGGDKTYALPGCRAAAGGHDIIAVQPGVEGVQVPPCRLGTRVGDGGRARVHLGERVGESALGLHVQGTPSHAHLQGEGGGEGERRRACPSWS